ncbi:hypothetical protein V1477_021329 [Vespula maculifrons]|uniref:Uncharacterized protein n=1 Tax=Vespula maculifrons TaxID=7453 RepID=A0ABD2AH20_VESMC
MDNILKESYAKNTTKKIKKNMRTANILIINHLLFISACAASTFNSVSSTLLSILNKEPCFPETTLGGNIVDTDPCENCCLLGHHYRRRMRSNMISLRRRKTFSLNFSHIFVCNVLSDTLSDHHKIGIALHLPCSSWILQVGCSNDCSILHCPYILSRAVIVIGDGGISRCLK